MPNFIVVSMYTPDDIYIEAVGNLVLSLDKFGIPHSVVRIDDRGSWEKNCQAKVDVILSELVSTDKNVVWVDADAQFTRYPDLFDSLVCDVGYYYLPETREYLSGTLFFSNTAKTKEFLTRWRDLNFTNTLWDQVNMKSVLMEMGEGLSEYRLPVEYCKIFDNKWQKCSDPVIVHYQASRKVRLRNRKG